MQLVSWKHVLGWFSTRCDCLSVFPVFLGFESSPHHLAFILSGLVEQHEETVTILSLSGEATWPAGSIIFFLSRLPCGTVSRGWPSFCKKTPSLSVDFHYNYCHCCCAFLIPLLFAINKLWSQIKVCFCSSLARGGSGKECLIWSLFSAWCLKHYTIKRFNSLIICAVSNHSGLSPLREKYSSRRSW